MTSNTLAVYEPTSWGLTPWEHQVTGSDYIYKYRRVLVGDRMGMGKTGTVYRAVRKWILEGSVKRILLLTGGRNAQLAWTDEACIWGVQTPDCFKKMQPAQRAKKWQQVAAMPACFVGTTMSSAMRDAKTIMAQHWDLIIIDEAHKYRKHNSATIKFLKTLCARIPYVLPCSGSLMSKGPQNIFAWLQVLYPKTFNSYWNFVNKYCVVEQGTFGLEIICAKNAKAFAAEMAAKGLVLYRDKDWMPPKVRSFRNIEPTSWQMKAIEDLMEECILELPPNGDEDVVVVAPSILTRIMRCRQLLVTPRILDPRQEIGAGLEEILEMLEESDDQHMVIFTPFTDAIPIIQSVLKDAGYPTVALQGGLSVDELRTRIQTFRSTRGVAVVSIKYAESFNLNSARWAVFLGYDDDPEANKQAEDRLHRGDIKWTVQIFYLMHKGTYEEKIKENLDSKVQSSKPIYDALNRYFRQIAARPKDSPKIPLDVPI